MGSLLRRAAVNSSGLADRAPQKVGPGNAWMAGLWGGDPKCTHEVQPGDTLSGLAEQLGMGGSNWPRLHEENRSLIGNNPDLIHPGQRLSVCPAEPEHGLNAYEVVPNDFMGPLGPRQIRQREHDELSDYRFDDLEVVGDDFTGPLSRSQMTQSQYDSLQSGWLRMLQGQGLALHGSASDQHTFKQMLRDSLTDSPLFRDMFTHIAGDESHTLEMDIGRSQPGLAVDAFEYRSSESDPRRRSNQRGVQTIDLDDYEAIPMSAPADHPNAQTRSQKLVHALSEGHHGLLSSNPNAELRYHAAHEHAIDAENAWRIEQGKDGLRGTDDPHSVPRGSPEDWRYDMDNGFIEDWDWTNTRLDGISYTEPP